MVSSSSITSMLPCTSKWLLACLLSFWRLHRNSIILVELYDFRRVHFWPPKLEAQLLKQPKNRIMEFYNSWSFPKSNPHYSLFLRENGVARNPLYYCIKEEQSGSRLTESIFFQSLSHLNSGNTVWPQALGFQKLAKSDHFWHFWLTFVHSKCNRSSLRSQCWMRLFLWFSNTVKR